MFSLAVTASPRGSFSLQLREARGRQLCTAVSFERSACRGDFRPVPIRYTCTLRKIVYWRSRVLYKLYLRGHTGLVPKTSDRPLPPVALVPAAAATSPGSDPIPPSSPAPGADVWVTGSRLRPSCAAVAFLPVHTLLAAGCFAAVQVD